MKNQSTQVAGGRWRLAGASLQVELLEAKLSVEEVDAFFLCGQCEVVFVDKLAVLWRRF